jgi:hypothetical protein
MEIIDGFARSKSFTSKALRGSQYHPAEPEALTYEALKAAGKAFSESESGSQSPSLSGIDG